MPLLRGAGYLEGLKNIDDPDGPEGILVVPGKDYLLSRASPFGTTKGDAIVDFGRDAYDQIRDAFGYQGAQEVLARIGGIVASGGNENIDEIERLALELGIGIIDMDPGPLHVAARVARVLGPDTYSYLAFDPPQFEMVEPEERSGLQIIRMPYQRELTCISRIHAQFGARDDGIQVKDLESKNGTVVNRTRVDPKVHPDGLFADIGDTITVGTDGCELIVSRAIC